MSETGDCAKLEKSSNRAEINEIQSHYAGLFEVIVDSVTPSTVVLVQPVKESSTIIELQFGAGYPVEPPDIVVTSKCLSKSDTKDLQRLLNLESSQLAGNLMARKLLDISENFIKDCQLSSIQPVGAHEGNNKRKENSEKLRKSCPVETHDVSCDDQVRMNGKKRGKKGKKSRRKTADSDSDTDISDVYAGNNPSPFTLAQGCSGYVGNNNTLSAAVTHCGDRADWKPPTHFIAVRITQTDIVESLTNIQKVLVEREPLLSKGVFTAEMFHVTLCTIGLETDAEISECIEVLNRIESDLVEALPGTPLTVHSMSQFYNRAVYSKVKHGDDFLKFRAVLRKKFQDHQVDIRDEREGYTPHVTVIKVKRPERRLFGTRNIKPSIYADFLEVTHGHQPIDAIYLCSMDGRRRDDGFYATLHEKHF